MASKEVNKDPALLILTSLADGPKHGYAMIEDIEKMTGVKMGPGTLYGAIVRLEQRGLIQALASDSRRKPYKLTVQGRAELESQLKLLQSFSQQGLFRLGIE